MDIRKNSDYTMCIEFKYGEDTNTIIYVDFDQEKIAIQNFTDDLVLRAFGVNEYPDWDDFQEFLKSRCFPETRKYAKQILNHLGIPGYDPLAITEATNGRTAEDNMYMVFHVFPKGELPNEMD